MGFRFSFSHFTFYLHLSNKLSDTPAFAVFIAEISRVGVTVCSMGLAWKSSGALVRMTFQSQAGSPGWWCLRLQRDADERAPQPFHTDRLLALNAFRPDHDNQQNAERYKAQQQDFFYSRSRQVCHLFQNIQNIPAQLGDKINYRSQRAEIITKRPVQDQTG